MAIPWTPLKDMMFGPPGRDEERGLTSTSTGNSARAMQQCHPFYEDRVWNEEDAEILLFSDLRVTSLNILSTIF